MRGETATTQEVVVVGGSFAGLKLQATLSALPNVQCTVVDSKSYFEFVPGVLRSLVDTSTIETKLLDMKCNTNAVHQTAVRVVIGPGDKGGTLELGDGTRLPWNHLVLATGSRYGDIIKQGWEGKSDFLNRSIALRDAAGKVSAAKSVVIVGGGTVGVELAAEIVGRYGRRKAVALVTSSDRLLSNMPPTAGRYALKWLASRGVRVVTGKRVKSMPASPQNQMTGGMVVTDDGSELAADLVFNCSGLVLAADGNTWEGACNVDLYLQLLKDYPHLAEAAVDVNRLKRKGIPVDRYLRVQGLTNVWAAGDVADLPFERTAYGADLQAMHVANNILQAIHGKELLSYPQALFGLTEQAHNTATQPVQMVVSLYKYHGIMQVSRTVICGHLPAVAKQMIETLQMQAVKGNFVAGKVWNIMESLSTILATGLGQFTRTW